jgi:hypothetical protein
MPTVKPRIQVTETDELAAALEVARELWPDQPKSAQISLLAQRGAESVIEEQFAKSLAIIKAFADFDAVIGDTYAGVTKDELRKMWERDDS